MLHVCPCAIKLLAMRHYQFTISELYKKNIRRHVFCSKKLGSDCSLGSKSWTIHHILSHRLDKPFHLKLFAGNIINVALFLKSTTSPCQQRPAPYVACISAQRSTG